MYAMSNERYPLSLTERIAGWWQDRRRRHSALVKKDESREENLERAALELDLTTREVSAISTRAYYTTDLLPLRMALLHLAPGETARSDPQRFRSLETSCRLCDLKGRCTFDIAQNPSSAQWQQYCPNATTLCAMYTRKMSG
jgi:hypothetical protein